MGITAMSHTLYECRNRFKNEPDISVVTRHRISHSGTLAGMTDCVKFCANRNAEASFNDDPTELPCLGFLFIDKGEPNCLIFVEHTPPPQQKVECNNNTESLEKPKPVRERGRSWQSELRDQAYLYLFLLMTSCIVFLILSLATLTAQTLSALGYPLSRLGDEHDPWGFGLVYLGFLVYGAYMSENRDPSFWEFGSCMLLALWWGWSVVAVGVFSWTAGRILLSAVKECRGNGAERGDEGEWVDAAAVVEKEDELDEEGVLVEGLGVEGQGK